MQVPEQMSDVVVLASATHKMRRSHQRSSTRKLLCNKYALHHNRVSKIRWNSERTGPTNA